jgi:tRNA pseudouridine32 synthase/23S rRNA pseudouridine746 synthase
MLRGLPADPPPVFGAGAIADAEPATVYEDEHLLVVNKPSGLLSVPGRSGLLRDSVSTRLRARYPDATGQLVVHRLDLDTSGLLLAAKDPVTFSALQRLFSLREISKRYVAWLDGEVAGSEGMIDFPIRMDLDDRPRQIHDPVHGKSAVTGWRVLDRAEGRTKVALTPHTGRTHQLRVHASNPIGLDAPIVGDRLYGRSAPEHGERLLLHAESLAFTHPETGAELILTSPAPF